MVPFLSSSDRAKPPMYAPIQSFRFGCSFGGQEVGHLRRRFGGQIGNKSRNATKHVAPHREGQGCGSGARRNGVQGGILGRRCTASRAYGSNVFCTQLTLATGQADPHSVLGAAPINAATGRFLAQNGVVAPQVKWYFTSCVDVPKKKMVLRSSLRWPKGTQPQA